MSLGARVLQVGSLPPPQGGIGTYLEGLLRSRVAQRYELTFFEIGVPPFVRRHRLLRPLLSVRSLDGLVKRLRDEKPHVVHVHVADFPGFWEKAVLARAASRQRIPVVLHLHGGSLERSLRQLTGWRARWVSDVMRRSAAVISPAFAWLSILGMFAPAERVVVLPNAIHLADFEPDASGLHTRTEVDSPSSRSPEGDRGTGSSSTVRLLFLGMLSARKGMDEILVAMRALLQQGCTCFHLDVVGGEEVPGALRLYRERFHAAGLDGWVSFHGERVGVEKLRFLHAAHIFVLPSRSESFGIANLEAMACGLPIVSTRTGAIPEYLEHEAHGLLVDPWDSMALAAALRRLIEEPPLRERLGNAARRRVCDYDWDVVGARLEDLYARCIGESTAARSV